MHKFIIILALLFVLASVNAQQAASQFTQGERVVFVGNSITHGGHYHSFVWLYYMTRFPDRPIIVINAGIGGETALDIRNRLVADVFEKQPTTIILTFGMNDSGYHIWWEENASELGTIHLNKSLDSFREIETMLMDSFDGKVVLLGGSPYDETSRMNDFIFPGKNDVLLKINDFQREAARDNGWGFIDLNRPMLEINQRQQNVDSTFSLCGVDRIHPDNDGQMVMAYFILKAQGLAGKKVSEMSVDAEKLRIIKQDNCTLSELKKTEGSLTFNYLAEALPFPIDTVPRHGWGNKKSQRDALSLVPFMEEFNQEILKVTNLEAGFYRLLIDGFPISEFSSAELGNGVNLATLSNTPQYQQALKVMFLNEERFEVEKRFRDYHWMEYSFLRKKGIANIEGIAALDTLHHYLPNDGFLKMSYDIFTKARHPEVRNAWQDYMDAIVDKIYKINQPVGHYFEIKRIS